jgi:hypothetical protein
MEVSRFLADDFIEPGNWVLLLAADRPFDLVDEDVAGFEVPQPVAAAVALPQRHGNEVRELAGE